ncbi:MAG: peptidoglycan DD-metalloendopeptidase family protein [Caldisericaceae bacterium]
MLNSKNSFVKFIAIFMVLLLMFLSGFGSVRSGIEEERKKLEEYQSQLRQIRSNIVSVEQSSKQIEALLNSLNTQLNNLEIQIKATQEKITYLSNEITNKEAQIKFKEEEIKARQSNLADIVTLSYELSKISPADVFYEGGDPNSVSKRITYITYISSYTEKLMNQAINDKKELENYKKELNNSKSQHELVLNEKVEQENILKDELDMKNRLLESLKTKKTYLLYKENELEEEIKKEEQLIQKLIEEAKKKGIYTGTFIWPAKGPITSEFGMRFHPILHIWRLHDGIDIGIPTGTPIKASADGTVTYVGALSGYGNVVILSHMANFSTLYAHLKSAVVKKGQTVKKGQVIAYSDNTGWSTGPHLHFSIYKIDIETGKSTPVNPRDYLP